MNKVTPSALRAAVYGANDGIITTFAVVAGVSGAGLALNVILIMGVANLMADGLSMAASDYLGETSEQFMIRSRDKRRKFPPAWHTSIVTFVAFVIAGTLPLIPYILGLLFGVEITHYLLFSSLSTGLALFAVGSARSLFTHRTWWVSGLQMFCIGAFAAVIAFTLGALI